MQSVVRFVRPGGGLVEFSPLVVATLRSMRQVDEASLEAGGVLLGRLIEGSLDVVVDEITTPGPADERSRYAFKRSRKSAQPRVTQAWSESAGTRIYLGDWHSHPEDEPTPSSVDRRDWANTLRQATYEQDFLLFAIVGRRCTALWEVRDAVSRAAWLRECTSSAAD